MTFSNGALAGFSLIGFGLVLAMGGIATAEHEPGYAGMFVGGLGTLTVLGASLIRHP